MNDRKDGGSQCVAIRPTAGAPARGAEDLAAHDVAGALGERVGA